MEKENLRRINQLAMPILLNYLVSILFETLDKMIVGHYSATALSAVGIGASLTYVVTGCFGVVSNAYHIQAAEYMGKKQMNEFHALFLTVLRLAAGVGIVWMIIAMCCTDFLFSRMMGISGVFLKESTAYFKVSSATVLLNLLAFVFSVFYRTQEQARRTLYFTVVSTAVNIFFDTGLVYGYFGLPELGACGAAWGSVIGLLTGLLVYVWPLRKVTFRQKRTSLKRTVQLFVSLFCQDLLESTVFTFFLTAFIAKSGVKNTAAYQLNDTLLGFMLLVSYAYAASCSTLVIQARAGKDAKVLRFKRSAVLSSFCILLPVSAALFFGSQYFYAFMTFNEEIIWLAKQSLGYILLLSGISVWKQINQSILQGCGYEKQVLIVSAAANAAGVLLAGWLSTSGLSGIYIGLLLRSAVSLTGYYILMGRMLMK